METNNYTPISILPILSKLLERYVHTCFSEYSTVTSLLHVTDTVDVDIFLTKLTSFGIGELSINGFRVTYLEDLNQYQ